MAISKGYNLSEDYDKLWEIINNGYRVPAWLIYSNEYKEPIWDLVEVKINPIGEYMIGTRGIGYTGLDYSKTGFIELCKSIELIYILPNVLIKNK